MIKGKGEARLSKNKTNIEYNNLRTANWAEFCLYVPEVIRGACLHYFFIRNNFFSSLAGRFF